MWEIYISNSKIYTVQAQNTQLSTQGREVKTLKTNSTFQRVIVM